MAERRDYREEYILHAGDKIESRGVVYTVTGDFVGYGGSGVVYSARSSEDDGHILRAIKEVFPNEKNRKHFERKEGVVCVSNPEDEKPQGDLRYYCANLEKEQKLGSKVYNSTIQAANIRKIIKPDAITIDGKRYTEVQENVFAVLDDISRKSKSFADVLEYIQQDKSEEHPLCTGGCPTVYTTACLLEQVLKALQKVHEQNVLFGDIHMGNILLNGAELEKKEIGIASFLDFGCARELIDGKKTAIIEDCRVYSTEGYVPPEILEKNDGTLQLGKEADIFSVGALMLKCLYPQNTHILFGRSPEIEEWTLQLDEGKDLGINDQVRDKINAILKRAMAHESQDRYPDTVEMLDDILKLKDMTELPKYILPTNMSALPTYISGSRAETITAIKESLKAGEHVFLNGMPGIGKTQLAIKAAMEMQSAKGAYLVNYTVPKKEKPEDKEYEAMEETVLRMQFSGYRHAPSRENMTMEELRRDDFENRLKFLKEQYKDAVLIVDNFDRPGEPLEKALGEKSLTALKGCGVHLIFTTRYSCDDWKREWRIEALPEQEQMKLMRQFCGEELYSDEELWPVIRAVQGHTLMIVLMGKAIANSRRKVTPEKLLERLENRNVSEMSFPRVGNEWHGNDEDRGDYRKEQLYAHMRALFDLSQFGEAEKKLLCNAVLLPETGMDCGLFESCLDEGDEEVLSYLLECGWLSLQKETNLLQIHPAVREVCIEGLRPKEEDCKDFLDMLWDKMYSREIVTDREINAQMFMCFVLAYDVLQNKKYYSYAVETLFAGNSLIINNETVEVSFRWI